MSRWIKCFTLTLGLAMSAAGLHGALLEEKTIGGIPTRVAKGVLTLVINQADGSFLEFEVGKDVPVTIDGQAAELAELETCGSAQVVVDDKTVKKVVANFAKEGDLRGTIKAVDVENKTVTIFAFRDEQAQDIKVNVTDESKIYLKGKPAKLEEIKANTQGVIRTKLRESIAILRAQ